MFPTIKQLERLSAFPAPDALLQDARGARVEPIQPRVLGSGDNVRIVLPGEPGYESASDAPRPAASNQPERPPAR